MGHNIPQTPRNAPPQHQAGMSANRPRAAQPEYCVLKHGAPAVTPLGQKKRYYKGSSHENPIELEIPIASARVGGTISVNMDGKTERVRYPAWVRHNEKMHFITQDGSVGCVKIKVTTLPGNGAVYIFALAALLMLLTEMLHIPFVDAWLARTSLDTGFEWYVMGVLPVLVLIHFITLYRYRSECRAQRPLLEDTKK